MKKSLFVLFVGMFMVMATASMVLAQPGGGGRGQGGPGGRAQGGPGGGAPGMMMGGGMMGGDLGILFNEDVRKELNITETQLTQLREAGEKMRDSFPRPQQGEQPNFEQMRANLEKAQAEIRTTLEKTLDKAQVEKLDVMTFQRSGGLDSPMVNVNSLRALKLTDEQKKKIEEINAKSRGEMQAMFQGGNLREMTEDQRNAMREKMEASRAATKEAIDKVLTADQKATAEKLMSNVPEYLQRPQGNRGQGGRGANADFGNWQPGQGGGAANPNREAGRTRGNAEGNRRFPGSQN